MSFRTLSHEDCCKVFSELARHEGTQKQLVLGIRNTCIALLMLDAGLRVGEVVKLKIQDLIYNSLPKTSIIISAEISKNDLERSIPVSVRLSEAINSCIETIWSDVLLTPNLYAFTNLKDNYRLTTRQVERIICGAAMKALDRPVHPHVLRHTFATNLMRVTDIRTVQELLGHMSLSSTQVYTHPDENDKRDAIRNAGQRSF